ncbi:MAG: hypothetical protein ACRC55_08645, partial [Plesiomonas sp.]
MGMTIVKNESTVKPYKGRAMSAGTVWAIYDPRGKEGKLFKASQAVLKEEYDAKFYNGTKDHAGSLKGKCWWLISTQHSPSEIMTVISKH